MKHFVLLIFGCCLLSGTALAQQSVGVRAGYGLSRMVFNVRPEPTQEWAPGIGGGLMFRTLSTPHVGLQLELLMEQKGWHLFPGTDTAYQVQEKHLSLPIQTVVRIGKGRLQLMVNAGVFVSYVLDEKVEDNSTDRRFQIKFQDQPRQEWQYGLLGGIGPSVRIGNRNWLQLEGRFAYNLSNRLTPNLARNDTFNTSQLQSVTISLSWVTQLSRE